MCLFRFKCICLGSSVYLSYSFIGEMVEIKIHKGKEDLPLFDFRTIANATNNFSLGNKLGQGGFGPVYKVITLFQLYDRPSVTR